MRSRTFCTGSLFRVDLNKTWYQGPPSSSLPGKIWFLITRKQKVSSSRNGNRTRKSRHPKLSRQELRRYKSIPEEVDFIDHPDFKKRGAEKRLFGKDTPRIDVPRYILPPEAPEADASPTKTPRRTRKPIDGEEEKLRFLRYNFSKRRLSEIMKRQAKYFSRKRAREAIGWWNRAEECREKIVHANLALVPAMAHRKRVSHVEFREQISEGYMAVLRSVEKFDVGRGFKFSTYACRSILSAFQYLGKKAQKRQQRCPTQYEPGMEAEDYSTRAHRRELKSFLETIREVVERNQAHLTPLEMQIMQDRYPLTPEKKPRTLVQVGESVGLTDERVRQIERYSLRKIRDVIEEQIP